MSILKEFKACSLWPVFDVHKLHSCFFVLFLFCLSVVVFCLFLFFSVLFICVCFFTCVTVYVFNFFYCCFLQLFLVLLISTDSKFICSYLSASQLVTAHANCDQYVTDSTECKN